MRAVVGQQRRQGTRRAALGAALALVLGLGLTPVVGALTAAPAAAGPVAVAGTIDARLTGHQGTNGSGTPEGTSGTNSNCVRFAPAAGTWSSTAVRAAHGRYSGFLGISTCPGTLSTTNQSAIELAPAQSAISTGTPFLLGTFRHYNNPVTTDASYYEGVLDLRVNGTVFSSPYVLWETPNTATPASAPANDDTVTFGNLIRTETFTASGMTYRLSVQGFSTLPTGSTQCSATPSGALSNQIKTVEQTTTVACLWAQADQVRPVSVVKQVAAVGDAPASVPATSFTSASTLAGSPWAGSSFTLTPTSVTAPGNTAALAARDFRATGEQLTLTENVPAANWELSSVTCRDGAGAVLGTGATVTLASRRVVLENVPDATTAAAAPITCTFVNTYVAPTTLTLVSTTIPSGTTAVPTAGWSFTVDALGAPLVTAGAGGSATGTVPVPGATRVVRVTETVQSGYVFDSVSCRRNDQATASFTSAVNPYDLTLERGRSYTCTVLNLRPAVDLVKQAFLATDTAFATPLAAAQQRQAGTALVWRYTVRNTGQTTLSGIVLRDATTVTTNGVGTTNGFTTISCPGRPDIAAGTTVTIPSLAPGQEIRCQASGVL